MLDIKNKLVLWIKKAKSNIEITFESLEGAVIHTPVHFGRCFSHSPSPPANSIPQITQTPHHIFLKKAQNQQKLK